MNKNRTEGLTDGIIAIIITIMVLEFHIPEEATPEALLHMMPLFLAYAVSFINVGIYWNSHYHLMNVATAAGGWVLWANLHLMFWLSLVPFTTSFMSERDFAELTVAVYCADLLMCEVALYLLSGALVAVHGPRTQLARAARIGIWQQYPMLAYALAIPAAYLSVWVSAALIVSVMLTWIIPERTSRRI